jgi:hypothetical protein
MAKPEQAAQADPNSAKVRAAQEDVAMAWLENIHARQNESFRHREKT